MQNFKGSSLYTKERVFAGKQQNSDFNVSYKNATLETRKTHVGLKAQPSVAMYWPCLDLFPWIDRRRAPIVSIKY